MKTLTQLATTLASLLLLSSPLTATDLTNQKLFGKWSLTPTGFQLGNATRATAFSANWIVVGSPAAEDRSLAFEGAVQIFNAATGAWAKKLLPPGPAASNQSFGEAVATSGNFAVVGAYRTNSETGAAYLYKLPAGTLLRTLTATDGAASDRFGWDVATNGEIIAIGSPANGGGRGAVYLYDLLTSAFIGKIPSPVANEGFGSSIALEGSIIAIGAPGATSNRGIVYLHDAKSLSQIRSIQPAASASGDRIGSSIAMHQGRIVAGGNGKAFLLNLASNTEINLLPGTPSVTPGITFAASIAIDGPLIAISERGAAPGRVHLFNSEDGHFLSTLLPPTSETLSGNFATSVSLQGNTLLATSSYDTVQAFDAGAVFLIKPLLQSHPYTPVVAKGSSAPGAIDVNFGTIGDVFVNSQGEVLFSSTLTGAGSNNNRDNGVFTNLNGTGVLQLILKSRTSFVPSATNLTTTRLSMNQSSLAVGLTSLTGTGVTPLNNQVIWYRNTTNFTTPFIRTGIPLTAATFVGSSISGTTPRSFQDLVSSNEAGSNALASVCTLLSGTGGVTPADDSALISAKIGSTTTTLREGTTPAPPVAGATRGQFTPRLALNYTQLIYSTALIGGTTTPASNAALFKKSHTGSEGLVAQKGDASVNPTGTPIPGVTYSTFIAESANGDNGCAYRATLTGSPTDVSTSTNEGIWLLTSTPSRKLAFRKGQTTSLPPGVKIAKLLKFWALGDFDPSGAQCLALVQLSGTNTTAANDQALMLWQENATTTILMREGDLAPGCSGARIGVISRIEADAWSSSYALLATLTGAPSSSNLALFTGNTRSRGNPTTQVQLRRPFLRMRKGQLFENQPSPVKSIALPASSTHPSGAGGTGLGRAISFNRYFAFTIDYANGIRQIVNGFAD